MALQVQQSVHEQEQALKSPLQQPQHRQSVSSSPKQSPLQSEQPSFGVGDADQADQGSFAALIEEVANATHQVHVFLFFQGLLAVVRSSCECQNQVLPEPNHCAFP